MEFPNELLYLISHGVCRRMDVGTKDVSAADLLPMLAFCPDSSVMARSLGGGEPQPIRQDLLEKKPTRGRSSMAKTQDRPQTCLSVFSIHDEVHSEKSLAPFRSVAASVVVHYGIPTSSSSPSTSSCFGVSKSSVMKSMGSHSGR